MVGRGGIGDGYLILHFSEMCHFALIIIFFLFFFLSRVTWKEDRRRLKSNLEIPLNVCYHV